MDAVAGNQIINKETEAQLQTLLDRYERKLAQARENEERLRMEAEAFAVEFDRLAEATIRPSMEAIGIFLTRRAHQYEVAVRTARLDREGRLQEARVSMRVFPVGVAKDKFTPLNTPTVTFVCDRHARKVRLHEVTFVPGGSGRVTTKGEWTTDRLTPTIVDKAILDFLKEIL